MGGRPSGRGARGPCFRSAAARRHGLGRDVLRATRARPGAHRRSVCERGRGACPLTSSEHVAVRSPLARTRTRIAAVPIWLWLGALVVVSAGIRLALAKSHPAPWIFGDELVYSNLAESVGRTGSFA